jgi:hypothetical protein
MLELLKKIGLPSTVAAIVATIVTLLPFILKLDERYAKAEELTASIEKTDKQLQALTVEVGRLAGIQQVLVAIAGQQTSQLAPQPKPIEIAPATTRPAAAPPAASKADPKPLSTEPVVVPAVPSGASSPADRRETLAKVQQALEASQRNIERIQKY